MSEINDTNELPEGIFPVILTLPWRKLCVDIIDPNVIIITGKIEHLNLKDVTMIEPGTLWFEITQ